MGHTMKTFKVPVNVPRATIMSFLESAEVDPHDVVRVTMTTDTVTLEFKVYNRNGELVIHDQDAVTATVAIPIS